MRLIFLGTPNFAIPSLRELCAAGFAPALVLTQPPARRKRGGHAESSPLGQYAQTQGLDLVETEDVCRGEVFERIRTLAPTLTIVVAFGQILKRNLLALPTYGCINLHPSLLPHYRGAAPIQHAMLDGQSESGITVMRLVSKLDAGPILAQRPFRIDDDEDAAMALDRAAEAGAQLLVETVRAFARGAPPPERAQDDEQATYAGMLEKRHGRIDFSQPARTVHNQIRGVQPWPGAFSFHRRAQANSTSQRLHIHRARQIEVSSNTPQTAMPGTVLMVDRSGVTVACGSGQVLLARLQVDGKPPRDAQDFLNGYRIVPGDCFGNFDIG